MRHYSWIVAVLAGAGLACAGCSTTGTQPNSQTSSNLRGDTGNGAFGEAVPAQYGEPAHSPNPAGGTAAEVQGHGFVGNGAFGETP